MNANNYQIVDRGLGGFGDLYNIDSLEVCNVVVAVRFTHWSNKSRKPYYEIPVSEKSQSAVIAAFPGLDIKEDEPGAILLYGCDDKTAVKVGMFAAELDGDLNPEPTTPATMNEVNDVEFSDLSHAGQCVYLCLMNTAEIYERYTVKAINRIVKAIKAGEYVSDNAEQLTKDIQEITPAINAAVRLVKKYDYLTPSAKDIEQVTRNYIDYIIECAEYEIKNA